MLWYAHSGGANGESLARRLAPNHKHTEKFPVCFLYEFIQMVKR